MPPTLAIHDSIPNYQADCSKLNHTSRRLLEGVGAGSPVGEEHAEADGLEDTGKSTDGDGVKGTLLGQDLGEDLVMISACSIDWNHEQLNDDVRKEQRKRRRSGSRGKQRPCR